LAKCSLMDLSVAEKGRLPVQVGLVVV